MTTPKHGASSDFKLTQGVLSQIPRCEWAVMGCEILWWWWNKKNMSNKKTVCEQMDGQIYYPLVNWHSNGTSPVSIGNTSSNGPFSIATSMLVDRSVTYYVLFWLIVDSRGVWATCSNSPHKQYQPPGPRLLQSYNCNLHWIGEPQEQTWLNASPFSGICYKIYGAYISRLKCVRVCSNSNTVSIQYCMYIWIKYICIYENKECKNTCVYI